MSDISEAQERMKEKIREAIKEHPDWKDKLINDLLDKAALSDLVEIVIGMDIKIVFVLVA